MPRYTEKEKAAYYRKKAAEASRSSYSAPKKRAPKRSAAPRKSYSGKESNYQYPGYGAKIGAGIGSMAGNLLAPGAGGYVGGALGSAIGGGAQALIKKITGFGDYHVGKNSLVYNVDSVPEFSSNNERCTMVTHREFISDILSSTNFNITEYRINPGIATTFPWLASIAENYEQYVVQGMIFEYKTTSATAIGSTNTALGTVIMATQYNSLAPNFINKQQMENYEFSQSTVPSQSVIHPIECDPNQTQCGGIFNIWNPAAASGDERLYDIGRFNIATVGMQSANIPIGELWVSYKICLLKPRLQSVSEVGDGFQLAVSSIDSSDILGTYTSALGYPQNSGMITLTSNNSLTINPGFVGDMQLVLVYYTSGNATVVTMPTITCTGNCFEATKYYSNISPSDANQTELNIAKRTIWAVYYIRCQGGFVPSSGLLPTVTFGGATFTASSGDVFNVATLTCMSVPSTYINDPQYTS